MMICPITHKCFNSNDRDIPIKCDKLSFGVDDIGTIAAEDLTGAKNDDDKC